MSFVYPYFLFALAAVFIPVIIHLFNFRRYKKIYFTNVRFLKEVKEETTHRSNLKHLLVLFSRMLALSFLVFAFAQPYIPNNEPVMSKRKKATGIYIDNSFSMSGMSEEHSLLDKAKKKSKEIVSAYAAGDEFLLLTNDFEGKHQRLVSREEFLNFLDEIKISPSVKNISEIISRQKQILAGSKNSSPASFIISDFQKNITDMDKIPSDTFIKTYFIPLQSAAQNNLAIDSCWFESPVQQLNEGNKLLVRLKNTGDASVDHSSLTLKINGETKAITDFSIPAKSTITDSISFNITQTGWHKAVLQITDYPVTFDDNYYFTFHVLKNYSVLIINGEKENIYLNAVFNNANPENNLFTVKNSLVQKLDYSSMRNFQFIILNDLKSISTGVASEINNFLISGGSVLVFPNAMMDINSYNSFLATANANEFAGLENKEKEVVKINTEEFIFKDVFEKIRQNTSFPKAKNSFLFNNKRNSKSENLLTFKDGNSFISKYRVGNGKLFVCASPLDLNFTDLPVHSVFVPMIYKMAISAKQNSVLSYNIAKDDVIEIENKNSRGENVLRISGNGKEFIPEQKNISSATLLSLHGQINSSGIYSLKYPDNNDSAFIAFNYDRRESDLSCYEQDELAKQCKGKGISVIASANNNLSAVIREMNEGITLWKLCIIFALIFLGIEILLLRFWK